MKQKPETVESPESHSVCSQRLQDFFLLMCSSEAKSETSSSTALWSHPLIQLLAFTSAPWEKTYLWLLNKEPTDLQLVVLLKHPGDELCSSSQFGLRVWMEDGLMSG